MAYLVQADVTNFLNLTGALSAAQQSALDAIIEAISAYADSHCNRTWNTTDAQSNPIEFTETFDGDTRVFFAANPPVDEVVSITIDGDTYENEVYNYGSLIRLEYLAAAGRRNVVITYTSAATLPADLKHALVRWAGEIFKAAEDGGKTAKRVEWGNQVSVEFLTQDGIPKYVQMVLDRYRLHLV